MSSEAIEKAALAITNSNRESIGLDPIDWSFPALRRDHKETSIRQAQAAITAYLAHDREPAREGEIAELIERLQARRGVSGESYFEPSGLELEAAAALSRLTRERDENADRLRDVKITAWELGNECDSLRDKLSAAERRIEELERALRIIAGEEQCIDNLMGNRDIARTALHSPVTTQAELSAGERQ